MNKQKGITPIIFVVAIAVIAAIGVGTFLMINHPQPNPGPSVVPRSTVVSTPAVSFHPRCLACPTSTPKSSPVASSSAAISGKIVMGPTCPNQKFGQDCTKPYQGIVLVKSIDDGHVVTHFGTYTDGTFSVNLSPGTYTFVRNDQPTTYPFNQGTQVIVQSGTKILDTITFDTGIR